MEDLYPEEMGCLHLVVLPLAGAAEEAEVAVVLQIPVSDPIRPAARIHPAAAVAALPLQRTVQDYRQTVTVAHSLLAGADRPAVTVVLCLLEEAEWNHQT